MFALLESILMTMLIKMKIMITEATNVNVINTVEFLEVIKRVWYEEKCWFCMEIRRLVV